MTTQTPTQSRPEWTDTLDAHRQNVSYVLMGLGGVLFVASAILMWKYGWDSAALIAGFLIFGLTSLGSGLWFMNPPTDELSRRDSARLLGLIVGGAFGFAVTVGGIWQAILWWGYVVGP